MTKIKPIKEISFLKGCIDSIKSDLILIITEPNVWDRYRKKLDLENSTLFKNKKIIIYKSCGGEEAKTIDELNTALEFFISKGIHRQSHLLAIGGGALSDLAGFVASTLLRGISWSTVPTTLLSMVDASIGGKVGINAKEAKNQIGSFHKPDTVYLCQEFLETLPEQENNSGKGEILKYCFLEEKILKLVDKKAPLSEIVLACAQYKLSITDKDFKEQGLRKILNLGHTFGHGVERYYGLSHGISVFWGMVLLFLLFNEKSKLTILAELSSKLDLNFGESPWLHKSFPRKSILELIRKDKKMTSQNKLDLILLENIGKPKVVSYHFEEIEHLLEEKSDELKKFTL